MPLADLLTQQQLAILDFLFIGHADWYGLVDKVRTEEEEPTQPCYCDEQVWTFLLACGYAAAGSDGLNQLGKLLTGVCLPRKTSKIWFEVRPIPPRFREGTSHLDLAIGDIAVRPDAPGSGIRLSPPWEDSWACFCECKWYCDVSLDVTHDLHRNQLTRIIENVLCFQDTDLAGPHYLRRPFFTLITPHCFTLDQDPARPFSRLYQFKFQNYRDHPAELPRDIDACTLEQRHEGRWHYPDVQVFQEMVQSLVLRWVTYDQLFANLPDSPLHQTMSAFWQDHGGYQGRPLQNAL